MYTDWTIDELVERSQETTGEESNTLKREIARRFREGIGVDADPAEADYWESMIEMDDVLAEQPEVAPEEPEYTVPEEEFEPEDYEQMDARALYRAYRAGDPWGVCYFAVHMREQGEVQNALTELTTLADEIERAVDAGNASARMLRLLPLVKVQMGMTYEALGGAEAKRKAQVCYEEVALEMGDTIAISHLLRIYAADGIVNHEKQILPMLNKLENGSVEERLQAAGLYMEMGRKTFATAIYEELFEEKLTPDVKLRIGRQLVNANALAAKELQRRSDNGDAVATFLCAELAYAAQKYEESKSLFVLCGTQDERLFDQCGQRLQNLETILAEKEQVRQNTKQALEAMREKAAAEKSAEQKKDSRLHFVKKHPVISCVAAVLVLVILIGIFGGGGGKNKEDTKPKNEMVDAFEDVVIRYSGIAPNGQVEVINNSTDPVLQFATYTAQPSSGLSNGDTFTVRVEYDKALVKEYGYQIKDKLKQYTVDGLSSYVTDISQIDDAARAAMEQQAADIVETTMARYTGAGLLGDINDTSYYSSYPLTYGNRKLEASYFLALKPGWVPSEDYSANRYIVTYSLPVVIEGYYRYDGEIFISILYNNLMVSPDGAVSVTITAAVEKKPLTSLEAVYKNRVSTQKEWYTIQEYTP